MKRYPRLDENHKPIVKELANLPGISVTSTAALGGGAGDIIVGFHCRNWWFEIKDPKKPPSSRKLTPDEKKFHDTWQGHIQVAETTDQILSAIGYPAQ